MELEWQDPARGVTRLSRSSTSEIELDIEGVCETRLAGNGDFTNEELIIIHSGNEKGGKNGVAVILRGKWKNSVLNTYYVNNRIMMIKLEAQPTILYIIQVYFPTENSRDEEIDSIYEQFEDLKTLTEDNSNLFIMGDFKAAVGFQVSQYICLGRFGYGHMSSRGENLIEFYEQYQQIISNTVYEVPNRRRYTWKALGDIRIHQIDYILV